MGIIEERNSRSLHQFFRYRVVNFAVMKENLKIDFQLFLISERSMKEEINENEHLCIVF